MGRLFSIITLISGLGGCGGSLPLDAYREGRYPAAAEAFRRIEADAADYSPQRRARYALYRGLTHLAIGDAQAADRFLSEAKRASDHHPEWLDEEERGALLSAWRSMGRMPGDMR